MLDKTSMTLSIIITIISTQGFPESSFNTCVVCEEIGTKEILGKTQAESDYTKTDEL